MIGFGLGQVQGRVFEDEVCLQGSGDTSPLTEVFLQAHTGACAKLDFLLADSETDELADMQFDGILGLGLEVPSVGGPKFSFLQQLVEAGKLDSASFALHLSNSGDSALTL